MSALYRCPVCGKLPEIEESNITYCGNKTVFVVHLGECELASRVQYVDMNSAIAGWNKSVKYSFSRNEISAKKSRSRGSVAKDLWGGE